MSQVAQATFEKLKNELSELGLYEMGMSIKEMSDLLAAIGNSQDSARKEQFIRDSEEDAQLESLQPGETPGGMRRRFTNILDRRMPWSLFPNPGQLSIAQRARIMAAYKEQQNICKYRRSRASLIFAEWNCIFSIPMSKNRAGSDGRSGMQTRSGRHIKATPHYVDDNSDSETSSTPRRNRKKLRGWTNEEIIARSSLFRDVPAVPLSRAQQLVESAKLKPATKVENRIMVKEVDIPIVIDKGDDVVDITSIDGSISSGERGKRLRSQSSSPEVGTSKMVVVAQVHRECQVKRAAMPDTSSNDDAVTQSDAKENSGISTRKRPKC